MDPFQGFHCQSCPSRTSLPNCAVSSNASHRSWGVVPCHYHVWADWVCKICEVLLSMNMIYAQLVTIKPLFNISNIYCPQSNQNNHHFIPGKNGASVGGMNPYTIYSVSIWWYPKIMSWLINFEIAIFHLPAPTLDPIERRFYPYQKNQFIGKCNSLFWLFHGIQCLVVKVLLNILNRYRA